MDSSAVRIRFVSRLDLWKHLCSDKDLQTYKTRRSAALVEWQSLMS
jgi:hypothetical protein